MVRLVRVPSLRVVVARKNRQLINIIPSDTRQISSQLTQVPSSRQSPIPVSRDRGPTPRTAPSALAPQQQLPMSTDPVIAQLLAANNEWRNAVHHASSDFFEKSAKDQSPKVLWIGCADSRVPESVVVAAKPGDLFVHRNIAKYVSRHHFRFPSSEILDSATNQCFLRSQFHPNDDSALSVLTYAVEHLNIQHGSRFSHLEQTRLSHTDILSLSHRCWPHPLRRMQRCI